MQSQPRRLQAAAVATLAAGLLLRLWFVRHAPAVSGDSLIYGGIAKNWMTRGVFGFYDDGAGSISPTLIRLPGYPVFLAVCFRLFGMEHYGAVKYVQVVLDLAACWLASSTARRMFGSRAGLATMWLAALCPFTANYAAVPLAETLVLLTIAAAFYSLVRWRDAGEGFNRWLWMLGLALAYSVLLRPEQGLLAAAVLPVMLWPLGSITLARARLALMPAAACILCVMLPLGPWAVRNWRTFHVFQPLAPHYANDPGEPPPEGFGRWYRSWAIEFASTDQVYWNYNGDRIDPETLPDRAFAGRSPESSAALREHTLEVLRDYNATALQTPQSEAGFAALAAERVRAHPVQYYLLLPPARLADMLLRPRTEWMAVPMEWWRWREHPSQSTFAAVYASLNLAYLVLGAAGFLAWRRRRFAPMPALAAAMAASVLLRCALLLTLDNSEPRYTLEFFPVLFVWAGALWSAGSPRRSRDVAAAHN